MLHVHAENSGKGKPSARIDIEAGEVGSVAGSQQDFAYSCIVAIFVQESQDHVVVYMMERKPN